MKIALSQTHFRLGDFEANYDKALKSLKRAVGEKADLLVFPEGGLWGYPPKDFLFHELFYKIQERKILKLKRKLPSFLSLLLPGFRRSQNRLQNRLQNGAFLLKKTGPIRFFAKEFLPNEEVFFESRYFIKGRVEDNFFYLKNKRIQILICEDFWQTKLFQNKSLSPPDLFLSINASPYSKNKKESRLKKLRLLAKKTELGGVYLNLTGAQDSLVFDGGSLAVDCKGKTLWQGAFFEPDFATLSFPASAKIKKKTSAGLSDSSASGLKTKKTLGLQEERKRALILGIKEFFFQTGFSKACLGLSGGIDSALTAYLAVEALGVDKVQAYFLPTRYTQKISYEIVKDFSLRLKLKLLEKNIEPLQKFFETLFIKKNLKPLTRQNLQSRLRMIYLMIQSNETGALLIGTGNKSELALGYSTLYGDLAGALLPIGDLLKTEVYDLALALNKDKEIFSKKLLLRPPTAELAPGQKDSQDLGPYQKLDSFLKNFLKKKEASTSSSQKNWIKKGLSQEFKRKQAPPILKLSGQDLGESWRYPIAHQFPLK